MREKLGVGVIVMSCHQSSFKAAAAAAIVLVVTR